MAGVNITIGADSRKAARELESFEKKTKGIAASIAKGFKERVGHKLLDGLANAARDIPQMIGAAINTASDLNEEISKGQVIFGSAAEDIRSFSKTSVESLGLSEVAAMTAAGQFGNLFKTMGMGESEVSRMSQKMTGLAADLGSFHNTTTEDAITAIGAALRGESEPIRRYGVLLDDATLKAEALAKGLYDGTGSLKPATRALAAYSVILKQTGDAQGDFARTSDGLAGQKKILKANIENLSMEIGQKFLPVMKELVSALNNVDFEALADTIDTVAVGFSEWGKTIKGAYDALAEYEVLIKNMTPAVSVLSKLMDSVTGGTVEKKVPIIEKPEWMVDAEKEASQLSEWEQAMVDLQEAQAKKAALKAEELELEKEHAEMMKEHDERAKASLHAERERLELLEEQNKEREKAAQKERDDVRRGIGEDIASTLADFGISEASQNNMLNDLLGIGFSKDEAKKLVGLEGKRQDLLGTRDQLDATSSRSSITAVSSMQRVGGGGGVYGELDLQKRQTALQEKMVNLLGELKASSNAMPLSDF